VMSKFLVMGIALDDVIRMATWNPAKELKQDARGHLSVGADADVSVLRLEQGSFGYVDSFGGRLKGTQRLTCEMTMRDGKVVYDLNGLAAIDYTLQPPRGRP
jgi:dihydroorotase